MMQANGDILLAAVTCPPAAIIDRLFKTLLRVRQAEFEAQSGVHDPNAWDVVAAAPGVPIDVSRELTGNDFASALARWRKQWVDRLTLKPWQEQLRWTLPNHEFGRKARGWFEAWLNNWLGNRHVARAIIRYGFNSAAVVTDLMENIKQEKAEETKTRTRQEDGGNTALKSLCGS